MSDQMRKEFEAWAGPYGHDISRSEINPEVYRCRETKWSYDAWQAARRAEPERVEPVAWMCANDPDCASAFYWKPGACKCGDPLVPLYTAPQQEQIE